MFSLKIFIPKFIKNISKSDLMTYHLEIIHLIEASYQKYFQILESNFNIINFKMLDLAIKSQLKVITLNYNFF